MQISIRRITLITLLICLIVPGSLVLRYKLTNQKPMVYNIANAKPQNDKILCSVDIAENNGSMVTVSGWLVRNKGQTQNNINTQILLKDENSTYYKLKTVVKKYPTVTWYFKDGINYDDNGFIATTSSNDLLPGKYTVYILSYTPGELNLIPTEKSIKIQ